MGTSRSPAELIGKIERAARGIDRSATIGVRASALTITAAIRGELVHAGVRNNRLSGVGKRGATVTVGFKVTGKGTNPTALGVARGPWQLIESDTKDHDIPRARDNGAGKGLRLPDGSVRRSVHHPGTKGKHPWAKGLVAGTPAAAAAFDHAVADEFRKVFR